MIPTIRNSRKGKTIEMVNKYCLLGLKREWRYEQVKKRGFLYSDENILYDTRMLTIRHYTFLKTNI